MNQAVKFDTSVARLSPRALTWRVAGENLSAPHHLLQPFTKPMKPAFVPLIISLKALNPNTNSKSCMRRL